jgi:hypothetical protein
MSKSLTSLLFQAARLSADGRAIRKGPAAVGKRIVRKQVYKSVNAPLNRILRKWLP